jgi:alcohol dehydrogenase (cytochrome c)
MRGRRTLRLAGAALAVALVAASLSAWQASPPPAAQPSASAAAFLRTYQPVTAARLLKPEPENWLMIRRTYDGWGYSPLEQITTANVTRLKQVWTRPTGVDRVHEAAPLVNNGVMFISTPANQVLALNASTGEVLWRYVRPRPKDVFVLHDVNRGVALLGDKVYYAAAEAVLVALDARTGKEAWTATVADNRSAYYITLAPLIAQGKVLVGASGGEFGVRGFIAAYDANTGKEAWRTYTVPAPGEPGSETWPKGDQWKTGGAPVWMTGNYDPESNLAFFGTGNGGPWMGDQRPGDNLYVASTVAIDVATGRIKGHFQYNPNESWDWDEVSPPIVVDYQRNGRTIKGLINVARDGYVWFLERSAGPIAFVEGTPYVTNNVYLRLEPKTGRPVVDPARKPGTGKTAEFCPNAHGGKNWPPVAFSPKTRLMYIPANNNICGTLTGVPVTYAPRRSFSGSMSGAPFAAPGAKHVGGEVQAWNVDTGKKVWTHEYAKSPNWGSMLVTSGNVVFTGGTSDRKLHAFDAATGKLLWDSPPASSGIVAPPTTFTVGGKQYLAVHAGWGGDPRGMQNVLNRIFPGEFPPVPEGGSITVYALDGK